MCMDAHKKIENPDVEDILATQKETMELIGMKYARSLFVPDI